MASSTKDNNSNIIKPSAAKLLELEKVDCIFEDKRTLIALF